MKKGYRYTVTLKQIQAYQKLSARHKLEWLEAANRFSYKALSPKASHIRDQFRKGTL